MMPWTLGLMSGTSMDGVDAALVRTDGETVDACGAFLTRPYPSDLRRELLRAVASREEDSCGGDALERALTLYHAHVVEDLLRTAELTHDEIALIGFHGHTVFHAPERGRTCQIGDGALLAEATGIPVINDFRSNDVAHGGQGAPLAPLYHRALAEGLDKPLAVLNIGGVANVTWIDHGGIVAFDTGPGNALMDDWAARTIGRPMDEGGRLARAGRADTALVAAWMEAPYFSRRPPKSLDRDAFATLLRAIEGMEPADGAATLALFTARSIVHAGRMMDTHPQRWLVSGGGRRNGHLMALLNDDVDAVPVEDVGWNGDALEAQAFAFLAQRARRGLALSVPGTTGVAAPLSGGVYHHAQRRAQS